VVIHPIDPIFDSQSKVLILGSFPSEKSRQVGFYYGHPQNRFWKVLPALFGEETPDGIAEKTDFFLRRQIAVWDVIASCDIEKSADHTIRNVKVNDISKLLEQSDIREIFVNGKTAWMYYRRYLLPVTKRPATLLPSTSPANASWSLERLKEAWGGALKQHFDEIE